MNDPSIVPIERLELELTPQAWAFAERHRTEIDSRFAELQRRKPALWNGPMLMLHENSIAGSVFRGSFLTADYASFLVWQDWGYPEAGAKDCFAQGVLRTPDGAFLLGVMAPHTAHAGEIYFPSGSPDPSDVIGAAVDFDGSVRREVAEETGLTAADYDADSGWLTVLAGPQIAHMKVLRMREEAPALRERILGFLARERQPELCDIRIVRSPADLDPMMPGFVQALLNYMWTRPSCA